MNGSQSEQRINTRPYRLSVILVLLFSLLLIVAMAAFSLHVVEKESKRLVSSMRAQAVVLADNLSATGGDYLLTRDYTSIEQLLIRSAKFAGVESIQMLDVLGIPLGDVYNDADNNQVTRYSSKQLQLPPSQEQTITIENDRMYIWQPVVLGDLIGWVKITYSLDEIARIRRHHWQDSLISGCIILVVVTIIMIVLLRRPLSTIERYTEFADRLDENQGETIEVSHTSLELHKLGDSLNRASHRLQEQSEEIRSAMSNLERLAAFPEHNPNIMMSMTDNGELDYLNPRGHQLLDELGLDETEISALLPEDIDAIRDKCCRDNISIRGIESNYQGHYYLWAFAPLKSQGLIHCYCTEITQRRNAEEQARAAEVEKRAAEASNKAKSAFLANMSHEIRTPLTAIIGFSESLLDSDQSMSERVDSINTIIRSGRHLLHVINEILDLSKIEADKLVTESLITPLNNIVNDVRSLVVQQALQKELEFSIKSDFPLPETIQTDVVRLKQILINLCSNAIKFTDSGSVTMKISCDRQKQTISFEVCDTGIGISEEELGRLFEAFSQADSSTTRQYGGTGLGLHLSRMLAKKLGGEITVESTKGEGSCFTATIDTGDLSAVNWVHSLGSESTQVVVHKSGDRDYTGQVLLVEDNVDNQRLISMRIKSLGAQVELAENGQVAVEKCTDKNYDLVLMDMQMPVMDGLEATATLRQQGYNGPIIALTANVLSEDVEKCLQAGCDNYLAKPIDVEKFTSVVSRYLVPVIESDEEISPIKSDLLETEPYLTDLVHAYVNKLPMVLGDLRVAFNEKDWLSLKKQAHNLKATGGSHGYMGLSKIAAIMEFDLAKQDYVAVQQRLDTLDKMRQCIEAGVENS